MKSLWNNFKVAFAMFSKIPMPRADFWIPLMPSAPGRNEAGDWRF